MGFFLGQAMMAVYILTTSLVFILALPVLPFLLLFSEKRRASLLPRLGMTSFQGRDSGLPAGSGTGRIWIHALSVGEVKSALPLVRALSEKKTGGGSGSGLVFTASTRTGYQMARSLFLDPQAPLVDQVRYFPLDLWFSVNRAIRDIDPDLAVLVETDLWPYFLYAMKCRNIPVVLVNARLSLRSLSGYSRVRPFSIFFFSLISRILAQTDQDRHRYLKLGLSPEQVTVTGNMKFDQPFDPMGPEQAAALKAEAGIADSGLVFTAGSTHEGEEAVVMDSFAVLRKTAADAVLVLAPRDPGRSKGLMAAARKKGFDPVRFSRAAETQPGACPDMVLVDRMGVLARLYAVSDLVFIGGSLVNQGGHNPLEAAACAKPVFFGPDMTDFDQVSALLLDSGGSLRVETGGMLTEQLIRLARDPGLRRRMGDKNRAVFDAHQGSVAAIVSRLDRLMDRQGSAHV